MLQATEKDVFQIKSLIDTALVNRGLCPVSSAADAGVIDATPLLKRLFLGVSKDGRAFTRLTDDFQAQWLRYSSTSVQPFGDFYSLEGTSRRVMASGVGAETLSIKIPPTEGSLTTGIGNYAKLIEGRHYVPAPIPLELAGFVIEVQAPSDTRLAASIAINSVSRANVALASDAINSVFVTMTYARSKTHSLDVEMQRTCEGWRLASLFPNSLRTGEVMVPYLVTQDETSSPAIVRPQFNATVHIDCGFSDDEVTYATDAATPSGNPVSVRIALVPIGRVQSLYHAEEAAPGAGRTDCGSVAGGPARGVGSSGPGSGPTANASARNATGSAVSSY